MVTGANPTPRMVPEFLTGRPTQSRDNPQSQGPIDLPSPTTSPQDQETLGVTWHPLEDHFPYTSSEFV